MMVPAVVSRHVENEMEPVTPDLMVPDQAPVVEAPEQALMLGVFSSAVCIHLAVMFDSKWLFKEKM